MKETSPKNKTETRIITDKEALDFVEHLKKGQEIFDGNNRFVFSGYNSKGNAILLEPDHLDKKGGSPRHHFLKEVLVKIVKNNPINIQDFSSTTKMGDPELEEFRKAQRKATVLERIEKEGLPFIETLSISEVKDKDIAKKIVEAKKMETEKEEFSKMGEESPYGKLSIKEIKNRALKNKKVREETPQKKEIKESWTEKIFKKVKEKRKKVLETFTKKSGYYGKLVLRGATALVASVGILHGELGRNTEINISSNTKVEEPAPKQKTAEEMLREIEGQFAENKIQAEKIEEEYQEKEDFAQEAFKKEAFRKQNEHTKEAFKNPISEQVTQKEEESSVETPVFEVVTPAEIKTINEPKIEISDNVLQDFIRSRNEENNITPTPEKVYEAESTPTQVTAVEEKTEAIQPTIVEPIKEERAPEPKFEQVTMLQTEEKQGTEINPTLVEYVPLTFDKIKTYEDLINYVCEGEDNPEKRWGELKILNAKEIIEHKGVTSVDPVFERLAKCLRKFAEKIGAPSVKFWGLGKTETVDNYTNRYLKSKK